MVYVTKCIHVLELTVTAASVLLIALLERVEFTTVKSLVLYAWP